MKRLLAVLLISSLFLSLMPLAMAALEMSAMYTKELIAAIPATIAQQIFAKKAEDLYDRLVAEVRNKKRF